MACQHSGLGVGVSLSHCFVFGAPLKQYTAALVWAAMVDKKGVKTSGKEFTLILVFVDQILIQNEFLTLNEEREQQFLLKNLSSICVLVLKEHFKLYRKRIQNTETLKK